MKIAPVCSRLFQCIYMHLQCDTVEDLTWSHSPAPGKIALVIGDILFLHGGISTESYGIVPGKEGRCSSVKDWVDQLNAWKDQQLQDFCRSPLFYKDWNSKCSTQIRQRENKGRVRTCAALILHNCLPRIGYCTFPTSPFSDIERVLHRGGLGDAGSPCHPEVAMVEKGGCSGSIFLWTSFKL